MNLNKNHRKITLSFNFFFEEIISEKFSGKHFVFIFLKNLFKLNLKNDEEFFEQEKSTWKILKPTPHFWINPVDFSQALNGFVHRFRVDA